LKKKQQPIAFKLIKYSYPLHFLKIIQCIWKVFVKFFLLYFPLSLTE